MISAILSSDDTNHKIILLAVEVCDILDDDEYLHVDLTDDIDADIIVLDGGQDAIDQWVLNHQTEFEDEE